MIQQNYSSWIKDIKERFRDSRFRAAYKVNTELLEFYWELGEDILVKLESTDWGSGFLKNLSKDLSDEFPEVKGFSFRNIKYIRQWVEFYTGDKSKLQQAVAVLKKKNINILEIDGTKEDTNWQQAVANLENPVENVFEEKEKLIGQQLVAQLEKQNINISESIDNKEDINWQQAVANLENSVENDFEEKENQIGQQLVAQTDLKAIKNIRNAVTAIPWGHNIAIISKCDTVEEALFYVFKTTEHGWSRNVLIHQIESGLYKRDGKALTNFDRTLPKHQSDLAKQLVKDPYTFDFLAMTADYDERELEKGLTSHITNFLLELGAGFAYMGKQVPLHVGRRDFYLDLLFYHTRLHCYVVIELKTGDFEPEYAGKLNFYIKAVDEQFKNEGDEPTIGILICKTRDELVAEYSLSDISKPIGVSEYQFTKALPENLKGGLPSIEEIEEELSGFNK
jgi:predicted nuclease of restriction endonuclease-like (RecB) superfamily